MMNSKWDEIIKAINSSEKILIFTHTNMDGDALGSSLALCRALRSINKNAYILLEDNVPKYLDFLNKSPEMLVNKAPFTADLAIAVDCGEEGRIEKRLEAFRSAYLRICIDHHVQKGDFADLSVVEPDASATGILIYELLNAIGIQLDKCIAEELYTAISTDTGSFMYTNTDAKTHLIAADLYKYGIDHAKICNEVYATFPLAQLQLEARAIDNASFFADGKVVVSYITQSDLNELNAPYEYVDTCINRIRCIEGVEISCMLKETGEGKIKASLRSKDYADVNKIAASMGGGGHKMASGVTLDIKLEDAKELVVKQILKELQ